MTIVGDAVAVRVPNDFVAPIDLPALIASIHAAIGGWATGSSATAPAETEVEKPTSVQIRRSVQSEGIVCFLDGKSYETLTRHPTSHGLAPETCRARIGLPADHPMVAPASSEKRSSLPVSFGLAQRGDRKAKR